MAQKKKPAARRAAKPKAAARGKAKPRAARRPAAAKKARKVTRAKPAARRKAAPAKRARHQPETLRLAQAGMGYTVADIGRSLAWYRDVLGCHLKERWEHEGQLRGAEMRAGAVTFYLGQDDWQKGRDRVKGQGCRLYVTTTQDIDALAASIKAKGWPLEQEPTDQPWGWRDFSVADPDGFKITIAKA